MTTKKSITIQELENLVKRKKKIVLIDVRSKEEYESAHIPVAVNIPLAELEKETFEASADAVVITVCGKGGGRSESAADHIRKSSTHEVYYLEGGTFGWLENHKSE